MGGIVTTSSRPRRRARTSAAPNALIPSIVALVVLIGGALYLSRLNGKGNSPRPHIENDTNVEDWQAVTDGDEEAVITTNAVAGRPAEKPGDEGEGAAAVEATHSQGAEGVSTDGKTDEDAEKKSEKDPRRRLRHGSEQLLAMIISTTESGVPPLPISDEDEESLRRDLMAAITNDIAIFEDEDERTQDVKERVADAKRQLFDILQNGGSVVEAIREYEKYVNEGAAARAEVLEKVSAAVDAIEDDAEAVEYVRSVNETLEKEDIPPIHLDEVGFEKEE